MEGSMEANAENVSGRHALVSAERQICNTTKTKGGRTWERMLDRFASCYRILVAAACLAWHGNRGFHVRCPASPCASRPLAYESECKIYISGPIVMHASSGKPWCSSSIHIFISRMAAHLLLYPALFRIAASLLSPTKRHSDFGKLRIV